MEPTQDPTRNPIGTHSGTHLNPLRNPLGTHWEPTQEPNRNPPEPTQEPTLHVATFLRFRLNETFNSHTALLIWLAFGTRLNPLRNPLLFKEAPHGMATSAKHPAFYYNTK